MATTSQVDMPLDPNIVDIMCQELHRQGDYLTLFRLIRSNKMFGRCRKLLASLQPPSIIDQEGTQRWLDQDG